MPTLSESGTPKTKSLERRLRELAHASPSGMIAVALSGGLDSRFLAHIALRAGIPVRALHANGPHVPTKEHAFAVQWAACRALSLAVVHINPLEIPELRTNPKDRCYHCKKAVFTEIKKMIDKSPLLDGTNTSDWGEYRPGRKALAELAVISPLAESGFTKSDIRNAAVSTGLEEPTQAAQPCLLTRFDYGTTVDAHALEAIDAAESAVRAALESHGLGSSAFRLRYETPTSPALHIALQGLTPPVTTAIQFALAQAGFIGIPVREMPTLSGYFDRTKTE